MKHDHNLGAMGGKFSPHAWIEASELGQKGRKRGEAAAGCHRHNNVCPHISPENSPHSALKIVLKLRGNKSDLGSTALCSVDPLTCRPHSGPSQLGEISDFICQNICLTQIIIFLANFDAV